MNEKLEAIAVKASGDIVSLVRENEKKILEAWHAAEDDANENDTKPKFKLAFSITLDLDKDSMETALSFGIKHTSCIQSEIPDPNQPALPLPEG